MIAAKKAEALKNKRMRQQVYRRSKTIFKNVNILGMFPGIDIALVVRDRGRYTVYKSIESFPPSMAMIVS